MKKNLLTVSIALMMSAAAFTSCVDNNESPSVTGIRDAKAEQLKSLAGMYKAQGEAELIRANFEKAYRDAETAFLLLKNESQSMDNDLKKADLLIQMEVAVAKAKKELADQLALQAAAEDALKQQGNTFIAEALTRYNTTFDNLYSANGLVVNLNAKKLGLLGLQNDLISIERYIAKEIAALNDIIAGHEASKAVYTSMDPNDLEALKAKLATVKADITKNSEAVKIAEKANTPVEKEKEAKLAYIGLPQYHDYNGHTRKVINNGAQDEISWPVVANGGSTVYTRHIRTVVVGTTTSYTIEYTKKIGGAMHTTIPAAEFNEKAVNFRLKTSAYVATAVADPGYFKYTEVIVEPTTIIVDAATGSGKEVGGVTYKKYELKDAAAYKKEIEASAKELEKLVAAKTTATVVYDKAKELVITSKKTYDTAIESGATEEKIADALSVYNSAKLHLNIARLELDCVSNQVDGGVLIKKVKVSETEGTVAATETSTVKSVTKGDITSDSEEGVYTPTDDITIETIVSVKGKMPVTSVYTYNVSATDMYSGAQIVYNEEKAAYDYATGKGATEYQAEIDALLAANKAFVETQKAVVIAKHQGTLLAEEITALNTMIAGTTDIPAMIQKLDEDIADAKRSIEQIRMIATEVSGAVKPADTAAAKEQLIELKKLDIANHEANISVQEVLLKKFKAELDALAK